MSSSTYSQTLCTALLVLIPSKASITVTFGCAGKTEEQYHTIFIYIFIYFYPSFAIDESLKLIYTAIYVMDGRVNIAYSHEVKNTDEGILFVFFEENK